MPLLHDPDVSARLKQRVGALRPDSIRRWGQMSIDQMLHHVNHALLSALGREKATLDPDVPLPKPILKFIVLHFPWPHGSPTAREWISTAERYDFDAEKAAALRLIDEVVAIPVDGDWPIHSTFGKVGGTYWSAINAKHLDHHLKQFSA